MFFYNTIIAFFLSIFLCLAPTQSKAQDKDQASYTFVGTHYPLILEQDENDKLYGLSVDILREISKETGSDYRIEYLPWGRALKLVKEGSVDGIVGIYKTEARKDFLVYSDLFFKNDNMMIISKTDSQIPWNGNLESLRDLNIITIKYWAYGDEFNAFKDNLNIASANKLSQGLSMLTIGRGDVLLANKQSALFEMKKLSIMQELTFLEPPVLNVPTYFAFSKAKNDTDLQDKFNAALLKLESSGKLADLIARHTLHQN